jgi:puromycin-sensitive aminopeptidase
MKNSSASERNKQDAALLIAKQLVQFWFGSFVTFDWWDQLWLQESISDYLKYLVVDRVYPDFNIVIYYFSKLLFF